MCLAFVKLSRDEVDVTADEPVVMSIATWEGFVVKIGRPTAWISVTARPQATHLPDASASSDTLPATGRSWPAQTGRIPGAQVGPRCSCPQSWRQ